MVEQIGDVVREVDRPPVITIWRHTWRSRVVWLVVLVLMTAIIVRGEMTRLEAGASWYFSAVVVAGALLQRFARRWQIETLRPAPQTKTDKQAYARLQYIQSALIIVGIGPLMWMMFDRTDSAWHGGLQILATAAFGGYVVAQHHMARATERLFARIAATDGAYGF